jgi:hypothetical protein
MSPIPVRRIHQGIGRRGGAVFGRPFLGQGCGAGDRPLTVAHQPRR